MLDIEFGDFLLFDSCASIGHLRFRLPVYLSVRLFCGLQILQPTSSYTLPGLKGLKILRIAFVYGVRFDCSSFSLSFFLSFLLSFFLLAIEHNHTLHLLPWNLHPQQCRQQSTQPWLPYLASSSCLAYSQRPSTAMIALRSSIWTIALQAYQAPKAATPSAWSKNMAPRPSSNAPAKTASPSSETTATATPRMFRRSMYWPALFRGQLAMTVLWRKTYGEWPGISHRVLMASTLGRSSANRLIRVTLGCAAWKIACSGRPNIRSTLSAPVPCLIWQKHRCCRTIASRMPCQQVTIVPAIPPQVGGAATQVIVAAQTITTHQQQHPQVAEQFRHPARPLLPRQSQHQVQPQP